MSSPSVYNFVAGEEDLALDQFFDFNKATETAAASPSPPAGVLPAPPPLGSPFAGPLKDLQGQAVGWLSPSAPDPVDGLDAVNFNDLLVAPVEETPVAPTPELAVSSTPQDEPAAVPAPAEDVPAAAQLETTRGEIAQLKAALAAETPQPESSSSSSPRKRTLDGGEVPSPKRQITNEIGPIEAFWSPKVTEDEPSTARPDLAPPEPSSPQHNFTEQSHTPPINPPDDQGISPEGLLSIQKFIDDNPALVYGTSQQVYIAHPLSDTTMAHSVNTKAKRVPPKQVRKRAPKATTKGTEKDTEKDTEKVTKKTKTAPKKKTQHQRTASTTSHITPSPPSSSSHRSIEELLAANFYSLNAQEKLRLMLPMLRNLDPRELENNLAVLPCIQAKGTGHEVTVANAIRGSPSTREDDDILATKLTFGTPPTLTPAAGRASISPSASAVPALQTTSLSRNIAHVEVSEDHGALRQREALKKAAALQSQGRKC